MTREEVARMDGDFRSGTGAQHFSTAGGQCGQNRVLGKCGWGPCGGWICPGEDQRHGHQRGCRPRKPTLAKT